MESKKHLRQPRLIDVDRTAVPSSPRLPLRVRTGIKAGREKLDSRAGSGGESA